MLPPDDSSVVAVAMISMARYMAANAGLCRAASVSIGSSPSGILPEYVASNMYISISNVPAAAADMTAAAAASRRQDMRRLITVMTGRDESRLKPE